jgi:hypothetical protein
MGAYAAAAFSEVLSIDVGLLFSPISSLNKESVLERIGIIKRRDLIGQVNIPIPLSMVKQNLLFVTTHSIGRIQCTLKGI